MAFRFSSLPPEVRARILPVMDKKSALLEGIGRIIAQKRDEAKAARVSANAEYIWRACEEAYEGIDDLNRGLFPTARWSKSMSLDGPVQSDTGIPPPTGKRSTVYIPLSARYTEAASAKVGEILLPAGEKSFSVKPTPVPELIERTKSNKVVLRDDTLEPLMRPARPEEAPPAPAPAAVAGAPPGGPSGPLPPGGVAPGTAPLVPVTEGDFARERMELADKAAKKAEDRIYDWLVQCDHQAQTRKVIFDAARLGTGILKGPFPKVSKSTVVTERKNGGFNVEILEEVNPATKWVNLWNFYPDPSCGEDIHDGNHVLELDYLSETGLLDLSREPGYISSQIAKVIKEGPGKIRVRENDKSTSYYDKRYEVWYYYGVIKREELDCICVNAGAPLEPDDIPLDKMFVPVIVTLVNDSVIKAVPNPMESGRFPYRVMPWQRRVGQWFGKGIPEQLDSAQRMLNGAVRRMLDNLGTSAGSQVVVNRFAIEPADGDWEVTPDKLWYATEDAMGLDVRQIFMAVDLPNQTDKLLKVIQLAMQMAEESTSIPLVTQGQSGKTTPETFGATKLQDTNANQLLRSLGYIFDDNITSPLIRDCYEVLLRNPSIPDDEKGDFFIDARGSSALVERAIQDQTVAQMGVMVLNPAYEGDPAKWFEEFLLSHRFNPDRFKYSKEKLDEMAKQPPPEDPTIGAAKVRAEVEMAKIKAEQETAQKRIDAELQLKRDELALEKQKLDLKEREIGLEAGLKVQALDIERDLEIMRSAREQQVSIDQIKKDLAITTMTLKTQERLQDRQDGREERKAQRDGKGQRKRIRRQRPPQGAEPNGRAANGQGFVQ